MRGKETERGRRRKEEEAAGVLNRFVDAHPVEEGCVLAAWPSMKFSAVSQETFFHWFAMMEDISGIYSRIFMQFSCKN